ncbi:MAG: DNA mismatch repair protein MutT [Clostridiales bacterium]|nr:MAG: DNA mismatch repair protein MutT [Clostridiales bacterium]
MDISFKIDNKKFNYRVSAIIIRDNHILFARNKGDNYYYLPGGRVSIGETAETAVIRELQEELGIETNVARPLWFTQSFYHQDRIGVDFHEIGLYFLMDDTNINLLPTDSTFHSDEKDTFYFEWLAIDRLDQYVVYPQFLQDNVNPLPSSLTMMYEDK